MASKKLISVVCINPEQIEENEVWVTWKTKHCNTQQHWFEALRRSYPDTL